MSFKLVSEFSPTGDQPTAIKQLVDGFSQTEKYMTLQGVTGSGKTFTVANVLEQLDQPTLVLAHNKTLAKTNVGLLTSLITLATVKVFPEPVTPLRVWNF